MRILIVSSALAGALILSASAFAQGASSGSGGSTSGASSSGGAAASPGSGATVEGSPGSATATPSVTNRPAGTRKLTPPRQTPPSESSAGGAVGGGKRQPTQSDVGTDSATQPTPRQAELMRKSEQIDHSVMRSICVGCGGTGARPAKKRSPPRVDVQKPLQSR